MIKTPLNNASIVEMLENYIDDVELCVGASAGDDGYNIMRSFSAERAKELVRLLGTSRPLLHLIVTSDRAIFGPFSTMHASEEWAKKYKGIGVDWEYKAISPDLWDDK